MQSSVICSVPAEVAPKRSDTHSLFSLSWWPLSLPPVWSCGMPLPYAAFHSSWWSSSSQGRRVLIGIFFFPPQLLFGSLSSRFEGRTRLHGAFNESCSVRLSPFFRRISILMRSFSQRTAQFQQEANRTFLRIFQLLNFWRCFSDQIRRNSNLHSIQIIVSSGKVQTIYVVISQLFLSFIWHSTSISQLHCLWGTPSINH